MAVAADEAPKSSTHFSLSTVICKYQRKEMLPNQQKQPSDTQSKEDITNI